MGCSICLDDFAQADGDARRASALRCGHIFHHDCIQTWFYGPAAASTHRPSVQKKRCPLCAAPAEPDAVFKLYPSDGDDLDTYLSGQQLWEWFDLDRVTGDDDRRWHKRLLEDLVDFHTAVQTYVMAAHGINCDRMVKSGVKIRKLVVDLTRDKGVDLDDSLVKAMASLEQAALLFQEKSYSLQRSCSKNRHLTVELSKEKERLNLALENAKEIERAAMGKTVESDRKMQEANKRAFEATDLELRNAAQLEELRKAQALVQGQKQHLVGQQRKMELETQIKLSSMKSRTEAELTEMRMKVEAATKKADDAEEARKAAHRKSCHLAEQMEKMKQHLKSRKKDAVSSIKTAMEGDVEARERRIRALEAQIKSKDELLKAAGIFGLASSPINRKSNRSNQDGFVDLRSSSPLDHEMDSYPATPLDGVHLPSQTSASALSMTRFSPTSQRKEKGRKRGRTSLSIEPERLVDESDDDLFPMPGLTIPRQPVRAPHKPAGMSTANASAAVSKPHSLSTSTDLPLAPRVGPQASSLANSNADAPLHKQSSANKKRKHGSTPPLTSTMTSNGSSTTSGADTSVAAAQNFPASASTSSTGRAAGKNRKIPADNYDWIKDPRGKTYGPKHRHKA